jgi:hypothetical protein
MIQQQGSSRMSFFVVVRRFACLHPRLGTAPLWHLRLVHCTGAPLLL